MGEVHLQSRAPPEVQSIIRTLIAADDVAATHILGEVLRARPELLPGVISYAVPDLPYAATRPQQETTRPELDKPYAGVVQSFDASLGMGFIECPELRGVFGPDGYVHYRNLGGGTLIPGTAVSFKLAISKDNKPETVAVRRIGDASSQSSTTMSGIDHSSLGPSTSSGGHRTAGSRLTGASGIDNPLLDASILDSLRPGGNLLHPSPTQYSRLSNHPELGTSGSCEDARGPSRHSLGGGGGGGSNYFGTGAGGSGSRSMMLGELEGSLRDGFSPLVGPDKALASVGKGKTGRPPKPDEQQVLGQFVGTIKSFSAQKGFGFIDCPQTKGHFQNDVYLHNLQIGKFGVGDRVAFTAYLNRKGQPQARDLFDASWAG
mmetsp:Transcript_33154/g.77570  ORF Transcript_33154/g.77570 Transcript_33154/m.77570 type:complete len:375 (-) Transcript_33154:183-1307(-)